MKLFGAMNFSPHETPLDGKLLNSIASEEEEEEDIEPIPMSLRHCFAMSFPSY